MTEPIVLFSEIKQKQQINDTKSSLKDRGKYGALGEDSDSIASHLVLHGDSKSSATEMRAFGRQTASPILLQLWAAERWLCYISSPFQVGLNTKKKSAFLLK